MDDIFCSFIKTLTNNTNNIKHLVNDWFIEELVCTKKAALFYSIFSSRKITMYMYCTSLLVLVYPQVTLTLAIILKVRYCIRQTVKATAMTPQDIL